MARDRQERDEWSLEDLIERRRDAEVTWPSAEERADAVAQAERMRHEMLGHADPGWMMFPSIADDGRAIPTALHGGHTHGDEHSHVHDHEDGAEHAHDGEETDHHS